MQQVTRTNNYPCFNCGFPGHLARDCRLPRKQFNYRPLAPVPTASTQDHKKKAAPIKIGRVNYTTLEDVTDGTQVMTGTFSVNQCPVVVLFDSGASHTFISEACVARLNLRVTHLKRPYIIHAPGAQLHASQCVQGVSLDLGGKVFQTDLIILPNQGIDVILGMNWMEEHRVILHTSSRIIRINSSTYGPLDIHLSKHDIPINAIYHLKGKGLAEIPVVSEYPDVFPEELPGMPPNRDVEFMIELQPGTAPVSRRPYRMTPSELTELKIQLQELLDKGFI